MLPPPPPLLLENNPNFADLYKHLTTNILAPDGSTLANVPDHTATATKLNEARASAIQDELLLRALEELATENTSSTTTSEQDESNARTSAIPRKAGPFTTTAGGKGAAKSPQTSAQQLNLPPEVRELVFNITAYLSASLNADSTRSLPTDTEELIAEDLAAFQSHLPQITHTLSSKLISTEQTLASFAVPLITPTESNLNQQSKSPVTKRPPSRFKTKPTANPPLSSTISSLKSSTDQLQSEKLPSTLTATASSLDALQTTHAQSLKSRIRTLELETHGSRSRYAMARSAYLCTVARGIELKTRILALEREKAIYGDEEAVERMEEEVMGLDGEEKRLETRERELMSLLGVYEDVGRQAGLGVGSAVGGERKAGDGADGRGEEVFRVLGARYKEVEMEIEEVRKDVERLETRVWRGR